MARRFHGEFRALLGCMELLALSVLTGRCVPPPLSGPSPWCCYCSTSSRRDCYSRNFARRSRESTVTGSLLALLFPFVGGTLIPVILLVVGDAPLETFGAVTLILAANLAARSLMIKIPHASHESRSAANPDHGRESRDGNPHSRRGRDTPEVR